MSKFHNYKNEKSWHTCNYNRTAQTGLRPGEGMVFLCKCNVPWEYKDNKTVNEWLRTKDNDFLTHLRKLKRQKQEELWQIQHQIKECTADIKSHKKR